MWRRVQLLHGAGVEHFTEFLRNAQFLRKNLLGLKLTYICTGNCAGNFLW
jgi:hypothetical protein